VGVQRTFWLTLTDYSHYLAKAACFKHGDQTITLTLKAVYWEQIKKDIPQAIQQYGAKTPAYWQAVRQLGLHYWLQWSRSELFELSAETR